MLSISARIDRTHISTKRYSVNYIQRDLVRHWWNRNRESRSWQLRQVDLSLKLLIRPVVCPSNPLVTLLIGRNSSFLLLITDADPVKIPFCSAICNNHHFSKHFSIRFLNDANILFDRNLLTSHSDKGNYQSLCGTNKTYKVFIIKRLKFVDSIYLLCGNYFKQSYDNLFFYFLFYLRITLYDKKV